MQPKERFSKHKGFFAFVFGAIFSAVFLKFFGNQNLFSTLENAKGFVFDSFLRFIETISIVTWPAAALVILVIAIFSGRLQRSFQSIFYRTNSIKFAGAEVSFSEEGAKILNTTATEAFSNYSAQAAKEIERLVLSKDIRGTFSRTLEKVDLPDKYRATIFVRDALFSESLFQLVNYTPFRGGITAGRRYSARYGIIGLSWRTEVHQYEKDTQSESNELIVKWGMTKEEASKIRDHDKRSCVAIMIRTPSDEPIGIIYIDHADKDAFGTEAKFEELNKELLKAAHDTKLIEKLAETTEVIRKNAIAYKIYD